MSRRRRPYPPGKLLLIRGQADTGIPGTLDYTWARVRSNANITCHDFGVDVWLSTAPTHGWSCNWACQESWVLDDGDHLELIARLEGIPQ